MKPFEEQFTAWIDGRLTPAERAAFENSAEFAAAVAEKDSTEKFGAFLRKHTVTPPLTHGDFFNHQILRQIAADSAPQAANESKGTRMRTWSLASLAWAGLTCLFAAIALFATIIPHHPSATGGSLAALGGSEAPAQVPSSMAVPANVHSPSNDSDYYAQVVESWPSDPTISATTVYNPEDKLTVVWLDGLDYIPANNSVK